MEEFFKYLSPAEEDRRWGIYLNGAGRASIEQGEATYPPEEHPSAYYFSWDKGRVLDEFQINYITRGSGIFETQDTRYRVEPGTLLIIRPGKWHRYRPNPDTGWTENYVGFDGHIPRLNLDEKGSYARKPLIAIGMREEFIDTYDKIFDLVREEKPGFQQVAAGMVMKLLGYMVSVEKQLNFTGKRIEKIIREACFLMREQVGEDMDFESYARQNHIGYAYFRKMFRQYTGTAPGQYQLDLKISKARELLIATDLSVKEIAFQLGFHSIHYFSRIFKKKTGLSPSEFRQ